MKETKIQRDYVMEFLTRSEENGGLGYRRISANICKDLFVPSIYGEFLQNAEPEVWTRLLRQYNGNEMELFAALRAAIKELFLKYQNVAIMFNKNKTFTFMQETLPLFYVSGAALRGDEDFQKNIFAVVEESTHRIEHAGEKLYTVRPDVTFYLNGIYIGYLEFKSLTMGQNAKVNGREKIAKDYLSTIAAYCQKEKTDPSIFNERKNVLSIYEKAIHLTASDINETYVVRNLSTYYDTAHAAFAKPMPERVDEHLSMVMDMCKPYPVSRETLSEQERFEEVMRALYSKKMIEKEIRYYNFIEYKIVKEDGKAHRTSNTGRLIAPRPKQKFGCDKIMNRILEMLENESDPNYYNNKLREQLLLLDIPAQTVEEILIKRNKYSNNKFVYSLLLQYAAGFGKSNIIGWTALQLKDYRYDGQYAYDKIMLVVDRLQLRDQLDTTMMNMNLDKSMFIEAVDKETFIKALDDKHHRIIVVNIQKFLDLQQAIDASGRKLKSMRVAFLIDEVHRSNSGENNKEMINLFERLQDSFNSNGQPVKKRKNLLIGFTATPDDETLIRFGEFIKAPIIPTWVPFDSYSMKEAIEEGYILDPTKHIIPYNVPVEFEMPEGVEEGEIDPNDVRFVRDDVYSFEPRMRKIAEFVVERLVTLVYGKIKGEGKAMLAVSSIPNAIKYCNILRQVYAKKCEEKLYARYKDAPIVIVYSDSQKYQPCSMLNGGLGEKEVIQNFKNAKNGLIIVVDKLQTGFDEPKLHTLFLDKEIKDINAIQTISRVNRTCKYKTECHVVDCSWQNVNVKNITEAFAKFCNMVVSHFNPDEEVRLIAMMYKNLCAHEIYKSWYRGYEVKHEDVEFVLQMENGIREWILQCCAEESAAKQYNFEHELKPTDAGYQPEVNRARDLKLLIGQYGSAVMLLKNIYDLDEKYENPVFLQFWNVYCKIFQSLIVADPHATATIRVVDSDEVPGISMVQDDSEMPDPKKNPHHNPRHSSPKKGKEKTIDDVLALLQKLNEAEQLSAQMAQIWLKEIGDMFQKLTEDDDLCTYLKDENFPPEDKLKKYKIAQNRYYRQHLKSRQDIDTERLKELLDASVEQLYATFLTGLKEADDDQPDFDLDTNTEGNDTPAIDWDDLMRRARKKAMEELRPTFNQAEVKRILVEGYSRNIEDNESIRTAFAKVVDYFFKVLDAKVSNDLDGINTSIPESLNILLRAQNLDEHDRNTNFSQLVLGFEGYLKKMHKMATGQDVMNQDPTKDATLRNAIFYVKPLNNLLYDETEENRLLRTELELLIECRNKVAAHPGLVISSNEVVAMIPVVIDMYLFATGSYIGKLRNKGIIV